MEVLDHKCPTCRAKLPFNPKTQKWDCEYCGNSYTLEQLTNFEEHEKEKESELHVNPELDLYECPDCGANIIADKNTTATFCVYCGNTSILKNRLIGEFKPAKIIPFKTTKEEAISAFKEFKKGKLFTPDNFNKEENIQKITGVYIPFWLYNCSTNSDLDFNAERCSRWRSGNYHYTKIDYYSIKRCGKINFNKVPVDGATKFDDNTMDSIEPFDYTDLTDFNLSYLSGFLSEKYDVSVDTASIRAKERIQNSIIQELKSTINGYHSVSLCHSNFDVNVDTTEYVLLPVWMLNIKYQENLYLFAMNGQTGKIIGDIPVDNKKFFTKWIKIFLEYFLLISIILFILMLIF